MAILNFDARTVVPDPGAPEPLPAGWYNVVIVESQMKPTSNGMGERLALVFQVIDGQYANRKLFEGLNLRNPNPAAQEIAFNQLSAIGHAVGHTLIGDSTELHNKPLKVKVKVKPAAGGYDAGNAISAYKNIAHVVTTAEAGVNVFAAAPIAPPLPMPPGPAAWTPPAQPAAWATAPAAAPVAAPVAPAAAPAPAWAAAPAPVAPAAPQLQAPPAVAAAAAAPAGIQPPWATAPPATI